MRRGVYYNENDPQAAEALRDLIRDGWLAPGVVDERAIEDVRPADVAGFRECHWFAGIGGWPLALRLAGWPPDLPIWTGSCPCQPFSQAGARRGVHDPRDVFWAWRWLIDQCRPQRIAGEQVASTDGRQWLARVRADLDLLGYAVGAADLPAASVGAPHARQRLFWLADADPDRAWQHARELSGDESVDAIRPENGDHAPQHRRAGGGMVDAHSGRLQKRGLKEHVEQQGESRVLPDGSGPGRFWQRAEWIECEHGKARRIEPGIVPLVDGFPGRVAQVKGYGNAIVPQVAARFLHAYLTAQPS